MFQKGDLVRLHYSTLWMKVDMIGKRAIRCEWFDLDRNEFRHEWFARGELILVQEVMTLPPPEEERQ